jgi:hypothetical protein
MKVLKSNSYDRCAWSYMNWNITHMQNCKKGSMSLMKKINTMINKKIVNIKVNKLNGDMRC